MSQNYWLLASLAMVLLAGAAGTQAAPVDKSGYTLFNPTPRSMLRELATDRPDLTESPYTVDAGHVQVEMSLLEYVRDREAGERLDEFVIAPTNLKLGLLHNLDLHLVFEPYVYQRLRTPAGHEVNSGFGNVQVRTRLNLWGNDGGETAFAIMPFVQFPTASSDLRATTHVEGGVMFPLAVELPDEWSLSMMAEIDFLRDEEDEGYGVALVHTVAVSRPIAGDLAGYLEYAGVASHDLGAGYIALIGGGFTYGLGPDAQLDCGFYFGLNDQAEDFLALVGVSFRL